MGKKIAVIGNGEVSKEIAAALSAAQPANTILINCADIVASPYNKKIDRDRNIAELAENIKQNGLLHPITVRVIYSDRHPVGQYEIVCGERRWRAYKSLGLPIPAFVRELSDDQAMDITVSENMEREDLSPMEESANIQMMIDAGRDLQAISDKLARPVAWVARRARLSHLSQSWTKVISNDESEFRVWSASHLELIARFDQAIQDSILNSLKYTNAASMSVKELDKHTREFMRVVSSAPWKLDDDTLPIGDEHGACSDCQKRSSTQTNLPLFDDENKKAGDRCLDPECWKNRMTVYIERKAAEFKQANPDAVLINNASYSDANLGNDHALKKASVEKFNVSSCKKSDPHAVQALIIDGPGTGTTKWIKKPVAGSSSGSYGTAGAGRQSGPKTMKEKEAGLLKRRILALFVKVDCLLLDIGDHPEKYLEKFSLAKLLSLALTFGLKPDGEDRFMDKVQQWKNREKLDDTLENVESPDVYGRILKQVMPIIRDATENVGYVSEDAARERKLLNEIGKFFGFDIENLFKTVSEEIPEPKSWATERLKESLAKKATKKKKSAE